MEVTEHVRRARLIPDDLKINNFDFLRVFLAISVVWSHCFALYFGSEENEPVSMLLNGVYNTGNIAVRAFFCISGFLITASYLQSKSLYSYFSKRVLRIYPGYIVCVMICSFIVIPAFSTRVALDLTQAIRTIATSFLLHGEFPLSNAFDSHPVTAVNGSLWSIPFEFWCYIGIAALGIFKILKSRQLVLLIAVAFTMSRVFLDVYGLNPGLGIIGDIFGWPYLWTSVAPCFLSGSLVYLYKEELPRDARILIILVTSAIVFSQVSKIFAQAIFPYCLAYLIFYFSYSKIKMPDAKYGDFSYGAYLYSFPIQQMLLTVGLPFVAYVPTAILLSLFAGVLSWWVIERHFLRRPKSKVIDKAAIAPLATE
ncbi:MAG: acyltransferase [Alphaproteobacteria bacterium]|nr:acyltransferase [Alphaproteobacteria bacterium]MBU0876362.1 acyltransferase [Alphaproteobacteria bacterium]MBU1768368.1 acyltransferase [Alphaproteobacteria bacterium]